MVSAKDLSLELGEPRLLSVSTSFCRAVVLSHSFDLGILAVSSIRCTLSVGLLASLFLFLIPVSFFSSQLSSRRQRLSGPVGLNPTWRFSPSSTWTIEGIIKDTIGPTFIKLALD